MQTPSSKVLPSFQTLAKVAMWFRRRGVIHCHRWAPQSCHVWRMTNLRSFATGRHPRTSKGTYLNVADRWGLMSYKPASLFSIQRMPLPLHYWKTMSSPSIPVELLPSSGAFQYNLLAFQSHYTDVISDYCNNWNSLICCDESLARLSDFLHLINKYINLIRNKSRGMNTCSVETHTSTLLKDC